MVVADSHCVDGGGVERAFPVQSKDLCSGKVFGPVASAAFEVGYESTSQFNREYSRFFGQPPMRDIRTLRAPGGLPLESVSSRQSVI